MSVRHRSRDLPLTKVPEKEHYPRRSSSTRRRSPSTARQKAKTTSGVSSSQKCHPPLLLSYTSSPAHSAERAQSPTDVSRGKGTKHLSEGAHVKEAQHEPTCTSSMPNDLWSPENRPIVAHPSAGQITPSPKSPGRPSSPQDSLAPALPVSTAALNVIDASSSPINVDSSKGRKELNPPTSAGSDMPEANIAVVGASGVGKSTFIQRALSLRHLPSGPLSARTMSVNCVPYHVRLLELEMDRLDVDDERHIRWPSQVDDVEVPHIQGALVLYDVMSQRSLTAIPRILGAMVTAGLPFVLVSCKCDVPSEMRELQPKMLERAGLRADKVDCFHTSARVPGSERRCIGAIIRKVRLEKRTEPPEDSASRKRTILSAPTMQGSFPPPHSSNITIPSDPNSLERTKSTTQSRKAISSRAGSPNANADALTPSRTQYEGSPTASDHHRRRRSSTNSAASAHRSLPSTAGSSVSSSSDARSALGSATGQHLVSKLVVVSDAPFESTGGSGPDISSKDRMTSFFKEADYDVSKLPELTEIPLPASHDDGRPERPSETVGVTLDTLVHRLLASPVSKADSNFPTIFLCLYRKFAAPREVLEVFMRHFQTPEEVQDQRVAASSTQLRHLSILSQWVIGYPGDFSHPRTRARVLGLIASLPGGRPYGNFVRDMRTSLENCVEDDDRVWARSDWELDDLGPSSPSLSMNTIQHTLPPFREFEGAMPDVAAEDEPGRNPTRVSGAPSNASSVDNSRTVSGASSQTLLNTVEMAEREAQLLLPIPRTRLTKLQWHQFMMIRSEDFAEELTRIDWILFSSVRTRDVVRHINLSASQKEKCKSVENVNRMINQFNHLAYWVTNMILLRDKPKHRARALEKFMDIAWKLRYLYNYNSLGAVIAGINGNAVYRLIQTRELVSPKAQKDFMSLEILMGTQRGHSAYRMAWSNTSTSRIPFLPLHRRDLIASEEGNRTFLDENRSRINWRKFEVMGEVIVSIQRSQASPYSELERRVEIQRLLLEIDIVRDDDELYDRSVELEANGAGAGAGVGDTSMRRKFSWFQR